MNDAPFDQRLANQAQAVDQCMKLGAVIVKPPSQPTFGFVAPDLDKGEMAQMVAEQKTRRNTR